MLITESRKCLQTPFHGYFSTANQKQGLKCTEPVTFLHAPTF